MGELIDGQPLFPGESEIDQLFVIQKVLGPLTDKQKELFAKNPRFSGLRFPEISRPETIEKRYLGKLTRTALAFMKRLLDMNPGSRMTASEALRHPYFDGLRDPADRPYTSLTVSSEENKSSRRLQSFNTQVTASTNGKSVTQPKPFIEASKPQPKMKDDFTLPITHEPPRNDPIQAKDRLKAKTRASPFVSETNEFEMPAYLQ